MSKKTLLNLAKSYDFATEVEFLEYILTSLHNGNFSQAKELFLALNKNDKLLFLVNYSGDMDSLEFFLKTLLKI